MQIRIYKFENNEYIRLGTTERATSITYNIDLWQVSEFEIIFPLEAKYSDCFKKDFFIEINNEFWGRIEDLDYDYAAGIVNVKGYDLKSLLKYRVVVPTDYTSENGTAGYMAVNGSTEYCIKHFWRYNAQEPPQEGRAYPNMIILPNQNRGIADDKFMARFNNLAELSAELCEAAQIGYMAWIDLNNHWICFEVYDGVDRSIEQSTDERAVFEVDRRNIAELKYITSNKEFRNAFYTTRSGAEFEDEALTLLYMRNDEAKTGLERRETHISVFVDTPTAGDEYNEMKRMAVTEMTKFDIEEGFSCELSPRNGYNEIWAVGDFVTVRHSKFGLLAKIQAVGVTIAANGTETYYVAKFGKQKPKFLAVGKQILKV